MGADSKIEWTHHTFNPWIGCSKVSEGCKHCYAESYDKRVRGIDGKKPRRWGPEASRERTSASYWKQPHKWNAAARKAGERHRVFCASLADDTKGSDWKRWPADLRVRQFPEVRHG